MGSPPSSVSRGRLDQAPPARRQPKTEPHRESQKVRRNCLPSPLGAQVYQEALPQQCRTMDLVSLMRTPCWPASRPAKCPRREPGSTGLFEICEIAGRPWFHLGHLVNLAFGRIIHARVRAMSRGPSPSLLKRPSGRGIIVPSVPRRPICTVGAQAICRRESRSWHRASLRCRRS